MEDLETLKQWVTQSRRIVFFGGAGVSTESGIPDFRSVDGLYSQSFDYPPETIISHSFYERNPGYFFRFYREKMLPLGFPPNVTHQVLARWEQEGRLLYERNPGYFFRFYREKMLPLGFPPNVTHQVLARWEQEGRLLAVVTQNIDGLHQKAGSQRVYELHGSVLRNHCTRCGKFYDAQFVKDAPGIPRCTCGGIVKPDVVLYEESLDAQVMQQSIEAIRQADLLIVGGTSLTVYPAAGLLQYYPGQRLVLINRDQTPYDRFANLVFHQKLGDVFSKL